MKTGHSPQAFYDDKVHNSAAARELGDEAKAPRPSAPPAERARSTRRK